jgi:hypothetical protein
MPYPFDANPLDAYLLKQRELKTREHSLRLVLVERRKGAQPIEDIQKSLAMVSKQSSELLNEALIVPRAFDVFLSDRDLQIKAFNQKNPKPERKECSHSTTGIRRQVQKNDSNHIVTQCLACGAILQHHSKANFANWALFPQVDLTLSETFNSASVSWYEKRAALLAELPPAIEMPEFDSIDFKEEYLAKHPRPIDPFTCDHLQTELTLRTYKNGASAVVSQCVHCGKHVSAVVKATVTNIQQLPAFDVEKGKRINAAVSEWISKYADEMQAARWKFNEERGQKIARGEINVIDSTTFGTYYASDEWANTRARIMRRDDYKCQVQACKSLAECVHHITYDRLGCENDLDLISLCTDCHQLVHQKQDASHFQYRLTSFEIRKLPKSE